MKKRMRSKFALGLVAMLIFLVACGGNNATETAASKPAGETTETAQSSEVAESTEQQDGTIFGLTPLADRQTLRIGFFAGSAHSMPWYVADKMGFFDELNIDVEYHSFTGGPPMMEASADWDVCDVGAPGVLNGMKNYDINMIGVCDNEFNTALFVRPDSDLANDPENPESWRGKSVLLNKGTTLQYMFMQFMKSIGIEKLEDYDISIVDTAVGTCLTAFQTGEGDAMCVWNAFACAAEEDGNVRVTDIEAMGLNNISGMCATADAINNRAEMVTLAFQTYYKTWEWCKENDENMSKAVELFMESCDDEGISVDEKTAQRLIDEYQCTSLSEAVAAMTTDEPDRNGSGETVTKATNQLFETLDFFISLGNYSEEDRAAILEKGLVNAAIAEQVK